MYVTVHGALWIPTTSRHVSAFQNNLHIPVHIFCVAQPNVNILIDKDIPSFSNERLSVCDSKNHLFLNSLTILTHLFHY